MKIDISNHLRRLVMAGLPLLWSSGCLPGEAAAPAAPGSPDPRSARAVQSCEPRKVWENQSPSNLSPSNLMTNVGFDRNDPRWSDLFVACSEQGLHCHRLCIDLMNASQAPSYRGAGIGSCELGCDNEGGAVATLRYSSAVPGRRPEAVSGGVPTSPGTSAAAFWAACAGFEGASVSAFEILADELRTLGAPEALVARAFAARADEQRHFAATRALAIAQGADPSSLVLEQLPRRPARALEAVALENATEGCVGETFAAAVALWQSATAHDPAVRVAMSRIADEELAHAQLAWDVDAWIRSQVDEATSARLDRARRHAADQLVAASLAPVDPFLVHQAGLPDTAAARTLAERARATLWV
jgi:hypothetical protein